MDAQTDRSMQLYDAIEWLHVNRKRVAAAAVAIAALIAFYFIWNSKKASDIREANNALFAIDSGIGPGRQSGPAASAYAKVASEHSGTPAGRQAQLLAAGALFEEGKYSEAQAQFEKFQGQHGDSSLAPQAAIGVAASLEAQGKFNEAITKYREVSSRYANENVGPQAKFALARLNEKQNKPDEALRLYDELMRNQDAWAMQARERRADLVKAHPELIKTNAPVVVPSTNATTVIKSASPSTNLLITPPK